ncbi:hypothetical protein KR067_010452, partial [Drosophila pandora]
IMSGKAGVVLNCRTCTRACKQHKALQDEIELGPAEGTTTLASMLNYCSGLSFEPQDGAAMPQHICMHCLQLLEQAFNFKRMVLDSDELLRLGLDEIQGNQGSHEKSDQFQHEADMSAAETLPETGTLPDENEEYVMIEMLGEDQDASILNEGDLEGEHKLGAIMEITQDEEEYVIEEVTEQEMAGSQLKEEHLIVESVHEYQPANVEYVTIKDEEYHPMIAEEDDIEVMDESATGGEIIHAQMIVIPSDEVIAEETLEMDENGTGEHLITEEVCEEDYVEESLDSVPTSTNETLPHVCKVCQKGFRQLCRLNQHMRSHVDEKHYECEECGKRLKHLRNYKEHMLTHTNIKPHQCDICGRYYRTTSSLAAHKRNHADEKPYTCDQCGRGYAALDHLRRHKLTHTGERPYACDLCDKAYYDSSSLRQHKISHTGEKAFTCEICGVGLSQKSGYKKHLLVHSGAKPHKCHICGRAFTFTSNLNAHVRLHSGEKPFKCDFCIKAFPTKKRLNSHLRVHNKEHPVQSGSTGSHNIDLRRKAMAGGNGGAGGNDVPEQPVSTSKVVVVL